MKSRLSRFIAEDPKDLSLRMEEAINISTEAFRLWAVATGYGQACDLYRYGFDWVFALQISIPFTSKEYQSFRVIWKFSLPFIDATVYSLVHLLFLFSPICYSRWKLALADR